MTAARSKSWKRNLRFLRQSSLRPMRSACPCQMTRMTRRTRDITSADPSRSHRYPSPTTIVRKAPVDSKAKLFTQDELAVLPDGLLDRQRQKQLAKKAKKKRLAAGRTEDELMAGFLGMGVDEAEQAAVIEVERPSKKAMRKEKKKAQKVVHRPTNAEMDAEARKEADFANFLQTVGEDDMDEDL